MADMWSVTETSFDPKTSRAYEGLFTLGSGYLHLRGSLGEHVAGAPQNTDWMRMPGNVTAQKFPDVKLKWGTYVPGVYGPHPTCNSELINLPWFLHLAPRIEGEKLDVEQSDVSDYARVLDMKSATLRRSLTWNTRCGAVVRVDGERFVSAARPSLCVQRMTLTSNRETEVEIRAGIDADVRTNGFDHTTELDLSAEGASCACRLLTDGGDEVRIVSRLIAPCEDVAHRKDRRRVTLRATVHLAADETVIIEKRSAVATGRDQTPQRPEDMLDDTAGATWDELHAEHAAIWRERWAGCDVEIDGDDDAQLAMRVSLYHLLRSHVTGDDRVAIDAKGYAGEAYWGRFFWDTEMYMMPFFLYTDPPRARTLCDFRLRNLPTARDNAASYGYPGAKFPWESDAAGRECCPGWQYRDHEVHVTADVVYALIHYARATRDDAYLPEHAAGTILEAARYWMARMDVRDGERTPSLLGVMGPDEYAPLSSNNAYTNRMVALTLATAAELGPAAGAANAECEAFRAAAAALPIPRDGGLVLQSEEFPRKANPRFDELWTDRSVGYANNVSQERLYRSKALKQADVLMLMALLPDEFSDEEVRAAWDYYVPLTTHDSSLSAGIHAVVACRLSMDDEAWRYWSRSSGLDLDFAHGGAQDGVHIACAAANWMVAVFGFAGLTSAMHTEVLTLRPRLPRAWDRLALPLVWRGRRVQIDITRDGTRVSNRSEEDLPVRVDDTPATLAPGETRHFG